ncbi:MAG: hypothetical protein O2955_20125, partial [Planctomycetota bacterium]|nr:hypothetical protein [Planctomycetota bacterium]
MFKSALFVVVLCVTASNAVASEFKELFGHVPRVTNSILVIDVDRTLLSKFAIDNGWDERFNKSYADRPVYLPPESDKVVVASQVDPLRNFAHTATVALMGMKEPISMNLFARAEGGYTDVIEGVKTAWVPSDAYFIEVEPHLLGMQAPANRKAIAEWAIRYKKEGAQGQLSPYLEAVTKMEPKGPQIVMALDTVNSIPQHMLMDRLEKSPIVEKHNLDPESLTPFFASMRGAVLEITVRNDISAKLQIQFDRTVPFNDDVAQEFVLGVLENNEMELPGIDTWKYEVVEDSIICSGDLSVQNMRRILSLMDIPSTKFSSLKGQDVETPTEDDVAANSQAYFHSIESLLADLRPKQKKSNASDAKWNERYASKIDNLPILHVDKDLLDYGENLSDTLRVMAGTRRMTGMQGDIAARHSGDYNNDYYNGYGYNYGRAAYRYSRVGI